MHDEFVNAHGLARILQLPSEWLIAEAKARRIPSLQIGRHLRFSVEAVRAALAKRAATADAENGARGAETAQSDLAGGEGE